MKRWILLVYLMVASATANAHEYLSLEEIGQKFGYNFDNPEVVVTTVADGLHVLRGYGGNVLVSIGEQGVLMVDSQFPQMIPAISERIRELGGGQVDFTVNTHWHFDHADGNVALGREGTWFIAQKNSRKMMAGEQAIDLVSLAYKQPAYPDVAMPVIAYEDHLQMFFNGQTIDLLHFGPAHTTGDTAVYFRKSNVVHMGDILWARYPFIDAGNGGTIDGVIFFCEEMLGRIDANTKLVPGHGPVLGYEDMKAFVAMLKVVRDRISDMIDAGMTLDEVMAAGPTSDFDDKYGDPSRFIDRAYLSLSR